WHGSCLLENVRHFYDYSFLPRETQAHFCGPFFVQQPIGSNAGPIAALRIATERVGVLLQGGAGLLVFTGLITDQFCNKPAKTSDASC
mgnify:CR=1